MTTSYEMLEEKALEIRKKILQIALEQDHGHIPSALSCVEILVVLYYEIMEKNDVFVMSKGHGALCQYAILDDRHRLGKELAPGCLERNTRRGVWCSTGSLGHGLPFAVGIALAKRFKRKPGRVYCLVGDAEEQEGSIHEALGLMRELSLQNFIVITDANMYGAIQKLREFRSIDIDGNDIKTIVEVLGDPLQPWTVFFETTKGKGIPWMENKPEYHFRPPSAMTPEEISWITSFINSDGAANQSCLPSIADSTSLIQSKKNFQTG